MKLPRSLTACLLAWCLATFSPPALPQGRTVEFDEEAEALFRRGTSLYSASRYRDAITVFDVIIKDYSTSHRITGAYVMKGKAHYSLNENLEAARTLKAMLAGYPESRYRSDALLTLGWVYERVGRYDEAFSEYRAGWRALPEPAPSRLLQLVLAAMDSVTERHTSAEALRLLLRDARERDDRAYLWVRIGEKELVARNIAAVSIVYDTLSSLYPVNPFPERVERLHAGLVQRGTLTLGVVLPLMQKSEPSAVKELGNDILEGIQLATDEYAGNPGSRVKVSLEIRDTEREAGIAGQAVTELAKDPAIVGILGPVFSSETMEAARIAQALSVPLMSPTANQNGIAALGPFVFQANADYEMRGRAMARFAVVSKSMTRLAVLAPKDSYAKFLADGFVAEAQSLGATLVAVVWYDRGASDLKWQFTELRRAAIRQNGDPLLAFGGKMKRGDMMKLIDLGVPLKRLDSLMAKGSTVRAVTLLGPNARALLDSLQLPMEFDESRLDSLEYPVDAIQALYVPISSPAEIGVISSQVMYFHVEARLLGSGEWNDIPELDANKRYADGIFFETDAFIDSSTVSYQNFVAGYTGRFKKRPGRNTLFGYDAAQVMLGCIRNGAGNRDALAESLSRVRDYRGIRSRIGFSAGRVNRWLTIVQYSRDAIVRVEEVGVE